MFWDPDRHRQDLEAGATAPPLLAHADLLSSAQSHKLQVAGLIHDQYLKSE